MLFVKVRIYLEGVELNNKIISIITFILVILVNIIFPYLKLIKFIKDEGYDFKSVKEETMLWLEEFKCFIGKFNYSLIYQIFKII